VVIFAVLAAYPFLWASAMFYQIAHAIGRVRPYYLCDLAIQMTTVAALVYAVAVKGMGAAGAAMAMGLTHGLLHILLVWPAGLMLVGGTWGQFVRQTLVPGFAPFGVALLACYGLKGVVELNSWLLVGLGTLAAIAAYGAVLLLWCLDAVDRDLAERFAVRIRLMRGRGKGAVGLNAA
jgi:hypothetical protein